MMSMWDAPSDRDYLDQGSGWWSDAEEEPEDPQVELPRPKPILSESIVSDSDEECPFGEVA